MRDAAWLAYVQARDAYLAAHERLIDRTQPDRVEPSNLGGDDLTNWLGLLQATAEAARVQCEAFERYCERRFRTGTATLRQHD